MHVESIQLAKVGAFSRDIVYLLYFQRLIKALIHKNKMITI